MEHGSRKDVLLYVNYPILIIVPLVAMLRIYTRVFIKKLFDLADIFITVATCIAITICFIIFKVASLGFGNHIEEIPPGDLPKLFKMVFSITILYATAITLTKCSLIYTYLQIFPQPRFRRLMYGVGTLALCIWFICVVIELTVKWDWFITPKGLATFVNFSYFYSCVNALTDFVLCIAPVKLFWELNMPLRERLIVSTLFTLGLVASIASVMRITQLHLLTAADITYNIIPCFNWSMIEYAIGIVCTSIPLLKPLFQRILPSSLSSHGATEQISEITASPATTESNDKSYDRWRMSHKSDPESGSVRLSSLDNKSAPMPEVRGAGFVTVKREFTIRTTVKETASPSGDSASDKDELICTEAFHLPMMDAGPEHNYRLDWEVKE